MNKLFYYRPIGSTRDSIRSFASRNFRLNSIKSYKSLNTKFDLRQNHQTKQNENKYHNFILTDPR